MTTTDNRVVSLRFDNSGFAQKISETKKSLQSLNEDLKLSNTETASKNLTNFFQTFKRSTDGVSLDPINDEIEKVQINFSKLEAFVSGMFLRLGEKAVDFGSKFIKSLSVDNIIDGYREYELKMESMKVIMASNTKYTLDEVNGFLDELNKYADLTIYKFSDMTTAIGRFVSMGVDVALATKAIQGASSLTALTGGGNAESTRVMYNTAQALATGYMSLMDWRSMENARVSGQWYQQIMQVMKEYKAAGKLSETQIAFYEAAKDNYGAFREGLKDRAVTSDIIVESLRRFSDTSTELGNRAMRAATEVTTFSKLLDTVKEGVGSAWARVFEAIFGNYEKSKELWTKLNGQLSTIFIDPVENFADKLKEWNTAFVEFETDSAGHILGALSASDELRKGLQNIFDFIIKALKNVSSAWKEVFGETPIEYLVELTIRFKKWTDKLVENEQLLDRIKRIAKDIFKVIKLIKSIIFAVANIIKKVVWPIVKTIFSFILDVAEIIFTIISGIANGLSSLIDGIFGSSSKITKIQQITEGATSAVDESLASIKDATAAIKQAENAINKTTESEEDSTEATKEATKAVDEYTSALEKAVKEGKTFSDENYIYTKNGLMIPKHVDINKNSIFGQMQSLVQAIKSIGTGTTDTEKNIQNSFKKIGQNVEKTVKKTSNAIKTVTKNGLLYKTFDGVKKVTDKAFSNLDKSFDRTKKNVVNFSNTLKGMFSIFNKNKTTRSSGSKGSSGLLPGINKSTEKLSTAIAKTNKKSSNTIQGIKKDTESLIDVYDKAASEPDKLEKIGTGISNALSNTLGYAATKMLKVALKLVGEETKTIDEKTAITDAKIKELFKAISDALAKGIMSISWNKIKEAFLNIWETIKGAFNAVKSFFSLWKDGENVMSSSSSSSASSLGKVEKKAKTIWEKINGILAKFVEFTKKVKESIKSFSIYDKKTGELKYGWMVLKNIIDGIKSTLYFVVEFIQTIGRGLKKISLKDFVNGIFKISTWLKNTKVGKVFSEIKSWIVQLKDDIDKFGFKKAFDNFFDHIEHKFWVFYGHILYHIYSLKDKIQEAFQKMNTDEWWNKLGSSKAYTFVSNLVSNLVGILSKAIKFSLGELVDIIFANVSSFIAVGSTDLAQYFRHAVTEVNGEMVEVSTWDKLKYIFENVFSGAIFGNLAYTKAGEFITWFVDTLFSTIGAKVKAIKDTLTSIFKRNKDEDKIETATSSSGSQVEEMSQVTKDINSLQIDNKEGINWDKILGGTVFMFTIARIVGAWKYFIKHVAKDSSGATSIATSIREIGSAFATIATGTTILAILSFVASLYIFTKAMEKISELDVTSLQSNAAALTGIIDKFVGLVIGLVVVVGAVQAAITAMGLGKTIATKGAIIESPKGAGLFSIAGIILSMAAAIAAIGYALGKLGEIDTTKMESVIKQVKPILYALMGMIAFIVAFASIFGYLQARDTKVPTTIDMGKFNMGNVFQTITNKNPFQGVPELVKNISTMILSLVGAFVGLFAVVWFMQKTLGKAETDTIIAKAGAILGGVFIFIFLILAILMTNLRSIAKEAGSQNIAKILGNFAWIMASLGIAVALIFLSVGSLIKKISDALNNDEMNNISIISMTIGIMVMVFAGLMYMVDKMMNSVLSLAGMVDNDEQKGKNLNKVLKAFAKIIKMMISPFKWIFAGIGLMIKLMSKASPETILSAAAIVLVVMGAVVLMIRSISEVINLILNQVTTKGKNAAGNISKSGSESLTKIFKMILGILITIFGAVIIMMAAIDITIGMLAHNNIGLEPIKHALIIFGTVFGVVAVMLFAIIGSVKLLGDKIKEADSIEKIFHALAILLGVINGTIALILGVLGLLIYNMKGAEDLNALASVIDSITGILAIIAVLVLLFAAFTVIASDRNIDGKTVLSYAGAFAIFALAIGLLAATLIALANLIPSDSIKRLVELSGIIAGLLAIFGIFTIIAASKSIDGKTILTFAGAFVIFSLAIAIIAAAVIAMATFISPESIKPVGILFGVIAGLLVAFAGFVILADKLNIDILTILGIAAAFVIFSVAIGIIAAAFTVMAQVIFEGQDFKDTAKKLGLMFGVIAALLLIFAGFTYLMNASGGPIAALDMLGIAASFIVFAAAVVVFAAAIVMIQQALSQLNEGDFGKIVGLLVGFVAILAILGILAGADKTGGIALGMLAVAAAFALFAAAIVLLAMAFGIFVVSFERFFDTMLRLPELIPVWQAFLKGLREQVVPELRGLLLALQGMAFTLIEGFMLGIWNLILDGLRYWSEHANEPVDLIITGIVAIIDGLANGATQIDTALTNLFTTIGDIVERHWNNLVSRVQGWFDNISDNAVVGFIQGIGSRIGDLWNAGEEMGDSVAEGAQDSLEIKSPSRLLEWVGKMAVKGLEKGIGNKEEQSGLYKAAGSLKDKLMDALNGDDTEKTGILDGLKDKVQGIIDGQDFTATIKGVLDMDEMMDQMNSLDTESLMGSMNMDSLTGSMNTGSLLGDTATAFSDMQMGTDASALMNQNGTGDVYNVTTMEQNNYSPKSLDAATQYRQSKNLVDASLAQDKQSWGFKPRRVDTGRVTAGGHVIYKYQK